MHDPADADMVPVFSTADSTLLPVIKSVLVAEDIPHIVQGEEALGLLPLGPFAVGLLKDAFGATVLVPAGQAERAREVLEAYEMAELDDGDAGDLV